MLFSFSNLPFLFFTLFLVIFTFILFRISKSLTEIKNKYQVSEDDCESFDEAKTLRNLFLYLIPIFLISCFGYDLLVKNGYESHVMDWLNLIVRWVHVVAGIAWIGASFYFIFLENSLNRTEKLRDELAGNLWAIHGGGFYYIEKYNIAPSEIPKKLHWFKYEAYFTWLTGFILLAIVYYANSKAFLIDPEVLSISSSTAIFISIGSLISGWVIYDILCKSPLVQKKTLFAVFGFVLLTGIAFFFSHVFSGRAAFMHVGALLGTVMAGNVFFVIIPSQKAMVKAAKKGLPLDPEISKNAGLRSLHNNYITLPVIFVMISNHFPATFGAQYNWAILTGLTVVSVAVRHYINMYEKGQNIISMLPLAFIGLIALVIVTSPKSAKNYSKNSTPVEFLEVQPIIQNRCVSCHSAKPTDDIQKVSPNGVMFDTPEQIQKHAERILVRAVQTKTMPQANKTGMTEQERELIGRWVEQGSKIK